MTLRSESPDAKVYGPMLATDHEQDGFDGEAILCPGCGFNYTHPTRVEVNAGGSITVVDAEGTRRSVGAPATRGVRITLSFWCESGCGFEWDVQFHKGMSFSSVRRADDGGTATIWRD